MKKPDILLPLMREGVDNSLVLWIRGQGSRAISNKVLDLSNRGNHGTITGATWSNTPLNHPTLSFDEVDDYVDAGNDSSLQITGTNPFTFELWFKANSLSGGATLLAKDDGGGSVNKWWLHYRDATYGIALHIQSPALETFYFNSNYVPSAGVWYHVILTRTGNDWVFYINGESVKTLSSSQVMRDASANFKIGVFQGGNYWNGLIDEVRVYNRALSASEISNRYNITKQNYGR